MNPTLNAKELKESFAAKPKVKWLPIIGRTILFGLMFYLLAILILSL